MRMSGFTEKQIVNILKSVEAGRRVAGPQAKGVCREHGISDATH